MGNDASQLSISQLEVEKPRRRKRNVLLDDTDVPVAEDEFAKKVEVCNYCIGVAGDEQVADEIWELGNGYVVMEGPCCLHESPTADSMLVSEVRPGVVLVLLKTAEGPEGSLWGLFDPPPASKKLAIGWAELVGAEGKTTGGKLLRKPDLYWEVGGAYRARGGTVMRESAEISSKKVCNLCREDNVEVLDFQVVQDSDSAASKNRPKFRAKVLLWRTREVGWVSPRNEDGLHLLLPLKVEKVQVFGRESVRLGYAGA